jgi:hypothetical protein
LRGIEIYKKIIHNVANVDWYHTSLILMQ